MTLLSWAAGETEANLIAFPLVYGWPLKGKVDMHKGTMVDQLVSKARHEHDLSTGTVVHGSVLPSEDLKFNHFS